MIFWIERDDFILQDFFGLKMIFLASFLICKKYIQYITRLKVDNLVNLDAL